MNNLGYLTDAIFHHRDGEVIDRGEFHLIRTPSNPTYFWGNCLVFKSAPTARCFDQWMSIYERELGTAAEHIAIGWDSGEKGDPSEFVQNGFQLDEGIVLSLSGSPNQIRPNPELEIRKLTHDWEWQSSINLQVAEGFPGVSEASYRIFKTDQMANYRLNQEKGHGHWWGAFLGDQLVGDMGLYFDPSGKIGRFQCVATAKAHRRKRVCTTLLDGVVRQSFARPEVEQLVIVTDQGSIAEKIYRSLGFQEHCFQYGLCRLRSSTSP